MRLQIKDKFFSHRLGRQPGFRLVWPITFSLTLSPPSHPGLRPWSITEVLWQENTPPQPRGKQPAFCPEIPWGRGADACDRWWGPGRTRSCPTFTKRPEVLRLCLLSYTVISVTFILYRCYLCVSVCLHIYVYVCVCLCKINGRTLLHMCPVY